MNQPEENKLPTPEDSARAEIQKEIDDVYQTINENQAECDKQILTLSSGFLAVALAFIKDVVPLKEAELLWLLYLAFALLVICIFSVLFSYQFSIAGLFKAKEYWDHRLLGKDTDFPYAYARYIRLVNRISGILFLLGVCSLVLFVILNLNHEANLPSNPATAQDGAYSRVPSGSETLETGANIKLPPPPQTAPVPSSGGDRGINLPNKP